MNMPRFSTLLLTTALLWGIGCASWITNYLVVPYPFELDHALRGIPLFMFGAAVSLAIGRILRSIRGRVGPRALVVVAVIAVIAATIALSLCYELLFHVIVPRWGGSSWRTVLEQIPMMSWLFGSWVLLYFALVADAERRDRGVQLAQATAAAIDAQHRLLVQQINPHFLFNTLNTISSFVTSHPEQARDLIGELAALLRDSIDETGSRFCPLGRECELAGKYLRIIGTRFGERFKSVLDVPGSLKTQLVPRGLLLTLIENAVTHGVSALAGECALIVHCTSRYRFLIVEVRNRYNHRIPSPSSSGHRGGLAALEARLKALYNDAYSLDYGGDDAGTWHVRVVLPAAETETERAPEDRAGAIMRDVIPHKAVT